jgi:hypothetical protein
MASTQEEYLKENAHLAFMLRDILRVLRLQSETELANEKTVLLTVGKLTVVV